MLVSKHPVPPSARNEASLEGGGWRRPKPLIPRPWVRPVGPPGTQKAWTKNPQEHPAVSQNSPTFPQFPHRILQVSIHLSKCLEVPKEILKFIKRAAHLSGILHIPRHILAVLKIYRQGCRIHQRFVKITRNASKFLDVPQGFWKYAAPHFS